MASFSGSDQLYDCFLEDLTKYKTSAANALKKFEAAYNDIMGLKAENNETSRNFAPSENESSNTSSLSDFDINSYNSYKFEHLSETLSNEYDFPSSSSSHASQCSNRHFHSHITSPTMLTSKVPKFYLKNYNLGRIPRCPNCLINRNTYVIPKRISTVPLNPSTESCVKSENNDSEINRCPVRVTVPVPFQMTIRDENQKPIQELKRKQLKEKLNQKIEKEMHVKIHSNPVPAHVYVPLYQQITETNIKKREQRRKKSAERSKNIVKTLNFTSKNSVHCPFGSMPDLQTEKCDFVFKAKPVPKHILSSDFSERLKHKEVVRKLRINERAQELLKHSSLPFSSKRVLNRTVSLVNFKKDADFKVKKVRKSSTHREINVMTREECQKVMRDWNSKVKKLACTKDHSIEQPKKTNIKNSKERYKDFLESNNLSFYDVPVRNTLASMLREREIRRELSEKNKHDTYTKDPEKQKRKKIREKLLVALNDGNTLDFEKDIEEKLKSYRASRRMRQIEYETELMEMQKRIEKQPLLIERQSKGTQNDKSTNTEPQDFINKSDSNRTLSLASSLGSTRSSNRLSSANASDRSH